LFDRYRLVDAAIKVVGIGSVGTLCMVALMMSIADHPFFLQVKQANASVLEAYAGKSVYAQHGERVVQGQRLMQPASDLSFGGPGGTNQLFLNPFVDYHFADGWSVGSSPEITTNWIASGGKWTVPVGGGFGKTFQLGRQPLKLDLAGGRGV
jgi:hypothetical protein